MSAKFKSTCLIAFAFPHAGTESWVGTVNRRVLLCAYMNLMVSDIPFFSVLTEFIAKDRFGA